MKHIPTWPPGSACERASDLDRAWLEAHPDEVTRYRLPIKGELDILLENGDVVVQDLTEVALIRVDRIAPGVRTRSVVPRLEYWSTGLEQCS